jgi:hypothetical protein
MRLLAPEHSKRNRFSFRQNRPRMTRIGTDMIRVDPLNPFHPRSIPSQIGKLNSPATHVTAVASPTICVYFLCFANGTDF